MEYLPVLYIVVTILASLELCASKETSYAECQFYHYKPECPTRVLIQNEFPTEPLDQCLHLQRNNIQRFPVSLAKYNMVPLIDVSMNKITSLPSDLTALAKLEILNVSYNAISTLSDIKFPTSLQVLSLAGNKITDLPAWFIPNLHVLELSKNQFTSIPKTFCVSQNLLRVDFLGNNFSGDAFTYIKTLSSCRNSAGVPFCFFADWRTMKCTCESVLPLVYHKQTFCVGNSGKFDFVKCSENSDKDFQSNYLYEVNSSLAQKSCALALMEKSRSAPLNNLGGSCRVVGFFVMLLFLKI